MVVVVVVVMLASTHKRADTEIVVVGSVVPSLKRHRGLSTGGVAPTHNRPDTEIVVVMVVMPPLDGHRGIMRSDGGDASPRRTQRYYRE